MTLILILSALAKNYRKNPWYDSVLRVRDPVSFLTLGIRNRFFPDPGSHTHIFESLVQIFWIKSSLIFYKLAQSFLFTFF